VRGEGKNTRGRGERQESERDERVRRERGKNTKFYWKLHGRRKCTNFVLPRNFRVQKNNKK
jgi:hypothetical protein